MQLLPNIKAFGVKSTPSGHLIFQEVMSNDLVVCTSTGTEAARYPGTIKFNYRNWIVIQP